MSCDLIRVELPTLTRWNFPCCIHLHMADSVHDNREAASLTESNVFIVIPFMIRLGSHELSRLSSAPNMRGAIYSSSFLHFVGQILDMVIPILNGLVFGHRVKRDPLLEHVIGLRAQPLLSIHVGESLRSQGGHGNFGDSPATATGPHVLSVHEPKLMDPLTRLPA